MIVAYALVKAIMPCFSVMKMMDIMYINVTLKAQQLSASSTAKNGHIYFAFAASDFILWNAFFKEETTE